MKSDKKKLYELKKKAIMDELGRKEILNQLTEECCELGQAAQKVRRAIKGTTPVTFADASAKLEEETADVLNCLEILIDWGMIDLEHVAKIQRRKVKRWFVRTFGREEM